jgi:CHASE3 domain sensor protein
MEQDIRNLFKDEDETNNKLPASHRDGFLEKLKASAKVPKQTNYAFIYKMAAALVLFVSIGFVVYQQANKNNIEVVKTETIEAQLKNIEMQYLVSIDAEWKNFIALAKDKNLVKRYQQRLNGLDQNYQEMSVRFNDDNNNISLIEALVKNLQTRLQLLKDIQEHIKILNQETKHYETII